MTMAAQSQAPREDDEYASVNAPSLMAHSRHTGSLRAPTRERVSEAIALVRARQSAEGGSSATKDQDASELKNIRSAAIAKKTGAGTNDFDSKTNTAPKHSSKMGTGRSPLAPAGQMGSSEKRNQHQSKKVTVQPNNFLQNVFASRSEVATTVQPDGDSGDQSMPDEPEENRPDSVISGFMNPLEFVKREFLLATQSASQGQVISNTSRKRSAPKSTSSVAISTESSLPTAPSIDQEDSADSFEGRVDAKTMEDVGKVLDKLDIKPTASSLNPSDSTESVEIHVDPKTIKDVSTFLDSLKVKDPKCMQAVLEQVLSEDSDPIRAMRNTISEDFIYGSNDDEEDFSDTSSNGSVNPETLAEIGAYIDAISKGASSNASAGRRSPVVAPSDGDCAREGLDGSYQDTTTSGETEDSAAKTEYSATAETRNSKATKSVIIDLTEYIVNEHELDGRDTSSVEENQSDGKRTEAVGFNDDTQTIKSVTIDDNVQICYVDDELALIRSNSSSSSSNAMAQTQTSKPSPIYEQVEAKSLPRGASKDPPAVVTSRNAARVDPPADMNEAVMRMHESQPMAPSYSAESLESGNMIPDGKQAMGDEKKMDTEHRESSWMEHLPVDATNSDPSGAFPLEVEQNLSPVIEAPTAESDSSEDQVGKTIQGEVIHKGTLLTNRETKNQREADIDAQTTKPPVQGDTPKPEVGNTDPVVEYKQVNAASTASELVDDAGVPIRTHLSAAESNIDDDKKDHKSVGRYDIIEADKSDEKHSVHEGNAVDEDDTGSDTSDVVSELPDNGIRNLPNSPSMKDDNSIPWELKDIASEETMKAAGRTRTAALNPASKSKARKLTSLLSDDTSMAQSTGTGNCEDTERKVDDGESASESNVSHEDGGETLALKPPLTFKEGEDGVEILETNIVDAEHDEEREDEFNEDDGIDLEQEYENDHEFVEVETAVEDTLGIPAVPSGGERASPVVDPLGHRMCDEDVLEQKPDPTVEGNSESDSAEDFVEAFLQNGSQSVGDCDDDQSKERTNAHAWVEGESATIASKLSDRYCPIASMSDDQPEHSGPGFLEQFESLECDDGEKKLQEEGLSVDTDDEHMQTTMSKSPVNLFTLPGIAKYFSSLDSNFEDESNSMAQNVKFFQRLVVPVVAGSKPSIIETAQIRQAALRADIPMEVVDRFLDLMEDERAAISNVFSSHSEAISEKQYEDIEDLNEDEAITAFLTRFGTLHRGGHFPNADVGAVQGFVEMDGGSAEEAVEIDAEFGFVNKNLAVEAGEDGEEEEPEWWKGGQQENKPILNINLSMSHDSSGTARWSNSGSSTGIFEEAANDSSKGAPQGEVLASPKEQQSDPSCHSRSLRAVKEEPLVLNTRYSRSHGFDDEEWSRRNGMATYGAGWEAHASWLSPRTTSTFRRPQAIDGVAAAENIRRFVFSKKIFKNHRPWKRLYKERTQFHPGFYDVDVHSIYESTAVDLCDALDEVDYIPWEHREVQQRFLHEKSFSFSRNWFGDLVRKRGNQKIKIPICKPKSMEMPIENVPDPGEWTKEWFTQWKSPADRRALSSPKSDDAYSTDGTYTDADTYTDNGTYTDREGTYRGTDTENGSLTDGSTSLLHDGDADDSSSSSGTGSERSDDDTDGSASWEEAPECGELVNVRQKIGERVTRVHPDFTSSLRRSRWRKKYFPRGTFPY